MNKRETGSTLSFRAYKTYFGTLIIALQLLQAEGLYAQIKSPPSLTEQSEKVPFSSRISFKTNMIDWLLIAPNLTVEYDLSNSVYNRLALNLGMKVNWNTHQNYKPSVVYNFFDTRAEVRYYWRTEKKQNVSSTGKTTMKEGLENVFSTRKNNPRYWRAYYAGGYLQGSKYTFKLGKKGIQGIAYGIGISAGLGIPLYGYDDRFIDLEFGGNIGMVITEYDVFTHDRSSNCYPVVKGEGKNMHIVPYPVINDLRISFVFRFTSIKDKYKVKNPVKVARQQERALQKQQLKEEKNAKRRIKEEEKKQRKEEKKKQKELDKQNREKEKEIKKENGNIESGNTPHEITDESQE